MMITVQVSGWNVGFEKVKFTLLLKSALGYSLSRAKRTTDTIMDNRSVKLEVVDGEIDRLLASMRVLGAQCAASVPVR